MTKMTPAHKKMRDRAIKAESQCEDYRKMLQEKQSQLNSSRDLSIERLKALIEEQKKNKELSDKLIGFNELTEKYEKQCNFNRELQGRIWGLTSAISYLNISGNI